MPGMENESRRGMAAKTEIKARAERDREEDAEQIKETADLQAQKPSESAGRLLQQMRERARQKDQEKVNKLKADLKASLDFADDQNGEPQPVRPVENLMRRVAQRNEEFDAKAVRANTQLAEPVAEKYVSAPTGIQEAPEEDKDIRDEDEVAA